MFAQKKTSPDIQFIDGYVPRGLIDTKSDLRNVPITADGLSPLRFYLKRGCISKIEIIDDFENCSLGLLLPRLVEPHAHIDKAFTWKISPNFAGTYEGALQANLEEYQDRNALIVRLRAENVLKLALKNGLRAIRSHIDSFGLIGSESWDVLLKVKNEWKSLIDLQLVALVPLDYWHTKNGRDLACKVANYKGLFGGVVLPPYKTGKLREDLAKLLELANQSGCGIDLHIDETSLEPGEGLKQLVHVLDQMKIDVPITCSHLSSMALLTPKKINFFADRLAQHQVNVIALPLTNFWLLSRDCKKIPLSRPFAPIKQLQQAGVTVAIGGDNVQDPWFPGGNFDPLSLMSTSMIITQSGPWNRLGLTTFTTSASRVLGLEWDGMFRVGSSADFVLLEADNWSSAMSTPPTRKVMIQGKWIT